MPDVLKIAVEGCCHGELNQIYDRILSCPKNLQPELLIICGDFQSLRDEGDLRSIAVPDKYKQLGDFHDYYNGVRKAPVLTVFVGGNHEASNYLSDLQHGGWVCDNIYYMGYSNVIWYKGLRIGGISGIYKSHNFYKPHYEKFPLNDKTVRSIYHTRFEDYLKMFMIQDLNINCVISHDWPEGIVQKGDLQGLLNRKPFFRSDIEKGELGSVPSRELLKRLMPNWWFSAHLHVRFEAVAEHDNTKSKRKLSSNEDDESKRLKVNQDEIDLGLDSNANEHEIELDLENEVIQQNNNEIDLDLEEDELPTTDKKELSKGFSQTNFLALDKCLPRRQFIDFLEVPITNQHESIGSNDLYYDLEFLKIKKWSTRFKKTEAFKELTIDDVDQNFIDSFKHDINAIDLKTEDLKVPYNFESKLENSIFQKKEYEKKFDL